MPYDATAPCSCVRGLRGCSVVPPSSRKDEEGCGGSMIWRFSAAHQLACSGAVAAFALGLSACRGGDPVLVDQRKVPGTYSMTGSGFTDELVLKADGTVTRTATRTSERWTQVGHWTTRELRTSRPSPNTLVEFTDLQPECAIGGGPQSKPFPWAVPETPLCARSRIAFFCYDQERLALCFDESLSYRFHRRGWFPPWR